MANTTIRTLPAATLAALSDLIPVDQADGTTRGESLQQIVTLLTPLLGSAAARSITGVAVNSTNQLVVTYNDGTTAIAGAVGGGGNATVPAAGLVHSTGAALAPEQLVASHILENNGTLDLGPAAQRGIIASVAASGSTAVFTMLDGSSLTIPTIQGPPGAPGSLSAGSLIGSARVNTPFGGASRANLDFVSESFTPESFGAQGNGQTIAQVLALNTRYAVAAFVNDFGATPYAGFATHPLTQSDDYCWWATDNSPTSGNTWDLSKQFTTTAAGYASPANTDESYFYIPIDHGVYQSGGGIDDTKCNYHFFHYDMPISGGGLAAGTVVVSVQMTHLRVTAQPSGFSLPSGTVLTSCPDMTKFSVGKQVYCPQGLVPLSNITAVNGSIITLGTVTVPGTASSPASVAQAQSTPFIACGVGRGTSGTGVQVNQQCIVYTPIAEANICAQTTMDHLAFWAADDYTRINGNRRLKLGHAGYNISPCIISTGGRLSMEGRGIATSSINSNSLSNTTGGASVFKMWPAPDAVIFITDINAGFFGSMCRTFFDYDGRGFTSYGTYTGNTNLNAYAMNQVNIARVCIWRCHGHSNYSSGHGCLEFARYEGISYGQFNENLWEGDTVAGTRGLTFGGCINIEMISNQIQNCEWAIEARSYCEHPILARLLLQSCGGAFTNRRADQFNIYSMFFGEFFGGDYAVSYRSYDIRDCDQVFFMEYNGGAAAGDNPGFVLRGAQAVRINGGYANCSGSSTCGLRIASSVRDGNINGSVTVRINDFTADGAQHAIIVEYGSGQITYNGVTCNGSPTGAVLDNTTYAGQVVNLNTGGGATSSTSDSNKALAYFQGTPASGLVLPRGVAAIICTSSGGPLYDNNSNYNQTTGQYTCPIAGLYRSTVRLRVADGGSSGAPAAGTSMGVGSDYHVAADYINWQVQNPTRTTLLDVRYTRHSAGDPLFAVSFLDAASMVPDGSSQVLIEWIQP